MKNPFRALLFCLILIVSCNKDNVQESAKIKQPESCDFLNGNYNTVARMSPKEQEAAFRRGGGTSPGKRDTDGDGIKDVNDNCPGTFNPDQADIDGDGKGDACDVVNDDPDKDGVLTAIDNCPNIFNPTQTDTDGDGIGDACDVVPPSDIDGDGIPDASDNCVNIPNPNQADGDADGKGDVCDPIEPPTVIHPWVILLDFDGHNINTVYWNNGVPFYATPSGMSAVEINNIIAEIKKDYADFPITITTDTSIYLKANVFKRQRVVITEYNEWYGSSGGVAYIGGIDWGGGSYSFGEVPAFVFSKALQYNQKYIGEAISHEAGHTLGLYHQIQCSSTGTFLSEYSTGGSSNPNAPIMGNSYFKPGVWWIGPNSFGCITIQNDSIILRNKIQ